MTDLRGKKKSVREWLAVRPILERLWLQEKRPMKGPHGIKETMEREFGFQATPNQYDATFRAWKWRKNQPEHNWRAVAQAVHAIECQGQVCEVLIGGHPQSPASFRRKISPYLTNIPQLLASESRLPADIIVRALPASSPRLLEGLPCLPMLKNSASAGSPAASYARSRGFEVLSWGQSPSELHKIDSDLDHRALCLFSSSTQSLTPAHTNMLVALKSVIPDPYQDATLYGCKSDASGSTLLQQILISCTNNFAGLKITQDHNPLSLLHSTNGNEFYQMFRSIQGHTRRSLELNLLRAGIETGNAQLVSFLLTKEPSSIEVNSVVCHADGHSWTAIERNAHLGHLDVTEALLRAGADVNKTFRRKDEGGALTLFLMSTDIWSMRQEIPCQHFQVLRNAGGEMTDALLLRLFLVGGKDLALPIILNRLGNRVAQSWLDNGVFHFALTSYDEPTTKTLIQKFLTGESAVYRWIKKYENMRSVQLMQIAVERESTVLIEYLHELRVEPTEGAILTAINLHNPEMLGLLMKSMSSKLQKRIFSNDILLHTAIESNNTWAIDFLTSVRAIRDKPSKHAVQTALEAAESAGNVILIKKYSELGGKIVVDRLSEGLAAAASEGRDQDARELLQMGADPNMFFPSNPLPLLTALKQRRKDLVNKLLEAGAEACGSIVFFEEDESGWFARWGALALAVWWGDCSVVSSIIDLTAWINSDPEEDYEKHPLTVAAQVGDQEVLTLLLKAGADLNDPYARLNNDSPLAAAIDAGNLEMTRFLLSNGADPHDEGALEAAMLSRDRCLLELLVDAWKRKRSSGQLQFGAVALNYAIKEADEDLIRKLIDNGADCNALVKEFRLPVSSVFMGPCEKARISPFGQALLQEANQAFHFTRSLLEGARCEVNAICASARHIDDHMAGLESRTPMLLAIHGQNLELVKLLVEYGAEINPVHRRPILYTPLQLASYVGADDIVDFLINKGANVNVNAVRRGGTALQLASREGYARIVYTLLTHGADVHATLSFAESRSALEEAAENGRLDVTKMLLNAGAGSKGKESHQVAHAIILADAKGHYPVADLLKEHLPETQDVSSPTEVVMQDVDFHLLRDTEFDSLLMDVYDGSEPIYTPVGSSDQVFEFDIPKSDNGWMALENDPTPPQPDEFSAICGINLGSVDPLQAEELLLFKGTDGVDDGSFTQSAPEQFTNWEDLVQFDVDPASTSH